MVRSKTAKENSSVSQKTSSDGKQDEKKKKQTKQKEVKKETKKKKSVSVKRKERKEKKEEKKVQLPILKHVLVPEMRIISEKEKQELLKRFRINEDKLPKMLSSDPCALALNAKVGDVVEIKRKEITGECLYYRIIVE